MNTNIYCLVDGSGHVHVKDGAVAYAEAAQSVGLDLAACDTYRFDLAARCLTVDHGSAAGERAANAYWQQHVGSPDRLMAFAAEGHLAKQVLGSLLAIDDVPAYLHACAVIEAQYTADCAARDAPCLGPGCAVEGEICLEPLLRAGVEYHKACGAAWSRLFADPRHRTQTWAQ
jgi:hypothetical protein